MYRTKRSSAILVNFPHKSINQYFFLESGPYVITTILLHTLINKSLQSVNTDFTPRFTDVTNVSTYPQQQQVVQHYTTARPHYATYATQRVAPPQYTQPVQAPRVTKAPPVKVQAVNQHSWSSKLPADCGVPDVKLPKHISLIINGEPARKGQFPWLVTHFYNTGAQNLFICGGSLISQKTVLTAAHCIQDKNQGPKTPEDSLFFLGKQKIKIFESETDYIISPAKEFKIHPEWEAFSESRDADIAIVVLFRTIQFSASIKPICLWSETTYHDIVDKTGVIAGYGKTTHESTTSSDIPYFTYVRVVDVGTCLRSNPAYHTITSKKTFCIGNGSGSGACNG